MSYTRIKICGITRLADALLAIELGADAIGMVFYAKSARCVTAKQAQEIATALPPFITKVGLFVDAEIKEINSILQEVPLDLLQFQGHETAEICRAAGKAYVKTIHMRATTNVNEEISRYPDARAILLDTYHPQKEGGTGIAFDWQLVPKKLNKLFILAGGLNSANVATAIATIRPYAVDVATGVESAPGIKDPTKLAAFIKEVRRVDREI